MSSASGAIQSIGEQMSTGLVLAALNMALQQRRPEQVIHHSDQFAQCTSVAFGNRCRQMGVQPTMGMVGDAFDNAMAESSFASLECELIDRKTFKTRTEAAWQYLPGSKAGTTPSDIIACWDTYDLLISKGDRRPLFLNLMSSVRSPS